MLKNAFSQLIPSMRMALWRFPLPILINAVFCVLAINNDVLSYAQENNYLAILCCCSFACISLKLLCESRNITTPVYYGLCIVSCALIAWRLHDATDTSQTFPYLIAGVFLSMFIAPFLHARATSMQIWSFNYRLWMHIGFTVLAAILLYLGITSVLGSVEYLFGLFIYDGLYFDILWLVASFFAPLVAMAGIPTQYTDESGYSPKGIQTILSFIAVPMLCIYAVILYGYIATIISMRELPMGNVAYLVSTFGCIGTIVYLATYPAHREKSLNGFFGRYYFHVLAVPLGLFAVAVINRINNYGVTEQRYALVLCCLWLTACMIFTWVRRGEHTLRFIIASASALLIFASFGPWNAVSVSAHSQVARLSAVLERNKILVDGKITPATQTIPLADGNTIRSIVEYMVSTQKTPLIAPWFAHIKDAYILTPAPDMLPRYILKDMGLDYLKRTDPNYREDTDPDYPEEYRNGKNVRITKGAYFNFSNAIADGPFDISQYDYLIQHHDHYMIDLLNTQTLPSGGSITSKLDPSYVFELTLSEGNHTIRIDLRDALEQLATTTERPKDGKLLPAQVQEADTDALHVKLFITGTDGTLGAAGQPPRITSFHATLLVKKK